MKIAVTSTGKALDSSIDPRFGRAAYFILFDQNSNTFEVIDNSPNLNAVQGAGIQAAEKVVKLGAKGLISGHCGPKAFRVLATAGIAVYNTEAGTVAEALEELQAGNLTQAASADVAGHW
ncbi:MAG: NifB/NifX family molybdenum-iron cluster-binding protein [Deltaproteobacteria bacterium]|nr:NifB/NifX family molybdenum-iron cluster-binding protein [Deltaproteobacteria bacterium]